MVLLFINTNAQNTATTTGNWNNCATWGNPSTIFNNTTDTKIINNGVTVTQNTAWSTNNVVLNGTGGITFASSSNSIDFVNDTGSDQSCCTLTTPVATISQPTCASGSVGSITITPQAGAQYSINGGVSYQSGNTFSNISPGNYNIVVRSTSDTSCFKSAPITLNNPGICCTAPAITSNPVSGTTNGVSNYTFSVAATGTGLTYQWQRDGVNISGATGNSYSTNIPATYSVVVMGTCGSVTSTNAVLTNPCTTGTVSTYTASAPYVYNPNGNSSYTVTTHNGINTDAVGWDSTGGFTIHCAGTYTVEGDVVMNITNPDPAGTTTSLRLSGMGEMAYGTQHFTVTKYMNVNESHYFWSYVSIGEGMSFIINNGKITKIN
ncbi:hypothetical protein GCM10022217_26210 [Chryseobacterium ginsenosidimutans]